MTRQLIGYDGVLEKLQAYQMIDEAGEGTYFYRLVLNFDAKTEDTNKDLHIWEIIEKTMLHLEDRFQQELQFVATEHDDHTPLRHVHMLALLPGKLNVQDFAALRRGCDRSRALSADGAGSGAGAADPRSASRAHAAPPESPPSGATTLEPAKQKGQGAGSRLVRGKLDIGSMCPRCGAPLGSRQRTCTSCGLRLPRREGRGVTWER